MLWHMSSFGGCSLARVENGKVVNMTLSFRASGVVTIPKQISVFIIQF